MKVTVWTSWNVNERSEKGKPKCIFIGETSILPRVGEYICLRDGFGCETAVSVTIDLVKQEAEISVRTVDPSNEYGACLVTPPALPATDPAAAPVPAVADGADHAKAAPSEFRESAGHGQGSDPAPTAGPQGAYPPDSD